MDSQQNLQLKMPIVSTILYSYGNIAPTKKYPLIKLKSTACLNDDNQPQSTFKYVMLFFAIYACSSMNSNLLLTSHEIFLEPSIDLLDNTLACRLKALGVDSFTGG